MQKPFLQSEETPQPMPSAQVCPSARQAAPPQSTPVSAPFFAPSVQVAPGGIGSVFFGSQPLQPAESESATSAQRERTRL